MPRKKMSGGNIKAESAYDPFPRSGLVKQFEPFIRKSRRPIPRLTKAAGSGSCENTIFRANLRAGATHAYLRLHRYRHRVGMRRVVNRGLCFR